MRAVLSEANESASTGFSMPAPTGGWNARDSVARMPSSDAIFLDNFFPEPTVVSIRKGNALEATLPAGQLINTILTCAKPAGTTIRAACTDDGVYDISAGGTIANPPAYVITTGKVESVSITVAGVNWLWNCSGVDKSFVYNSGTNTWQVIDNASTPALTGLASADVTNVGLWKNRIILCEKDSLSFWYLPLNSVGGAASEFDLGAVFRRGGYLVATANWSIDAGDGPDDRFVAISSEGEIAIYQGTDPSSSTTFALVGVYYIGKPIGKRCFTQIAGEVAVLTETGLWPLSKALQSSTIDRKPALTDKIQNAFNSYYKDFGSVYGWQPILYPAGPAILVNIPLTNLVSYQFVMNTITGAWCRFTNWNATCFVVSEGNLYFAMNNKVYQAWTGKNDNNAAIVGGVKTAFTYGPASRRSKHIKLVRPILTADASITVQLALDTDFSDRRLISSVTNFLQNVAIWDTALYNQAYWSGGDVTISSWRTVAHKPGSAWALRLRCSVKDIDVSWSSVDYICEVGGLMG